MLRSLIRAREALLLLAIPAAVVTYARSTLADDGETVTDVPPNEESPDGDSCEGPATSAAADELTRGDGRPVGADIVRVPAHIDAAELTSAEWGVIPSSYLDSWLNYGGGNFMWKRSRSAPAGGELDAGSVTWSGLDDSGQDLPKARGGGSAVALYTYTIKSSTEKTKKIKRFAEATLTSEVGAATTAGKANAKVKLSVDTESDFEHNISEKVNITISIKCASYDASAQPNPTPAILYFGPDNVKRDLPLPIKGADGKPRVIKWNPIVVDAGFSADNGATSGTAVACWFKYTGSIEKGEVSNANWETKKGAAAEVGVQGGWRLWKFTADISVEGKAAGEWHDMDKTEFSKGATGTWALTGDDYWLFPTPPTQKQRDDFQKPCKDDKDAVACAQWDNIKAAYMSEIMRVKGVDGATDYGSNYRMAEWQGAMLTGSFRKVGDWLDSTTFFDLAELQQVGQDCKLIASALRVFPRLIPDLTFKYSGSIEGLSSNRCSVTDMAKLMDTTTKVGKIEVAVLAQGNTTRHAVDYIKKDGYKCGHKDWDWDNAGKYPFPFWFFAQKIAERQEKKPKDYLYPNAPEYVCWGCYEVNGKDCDN